MTAATNTYLDRRTGALRADPVHAERFLDWSCNTRVGRALTHALFSRKFFSTAYGWFHKQPWSRCKIRTFVERLNVNSAESIRPIEDFSSLNDFFTREIDLSQRPIDPDPGVCVAPTDGRILAYPEIDATQSFPIKGNLFDLRRFLGDDGLTERFSGGSMIVSRLYLSDYHHFHFPAAGIPGPAVPIGGRYFTVGPYARERPMPSYAENSRAVTMIESTNFGSVAMVEIGAFTVGSIQQRYRPGERVTKGDRKGFFEIGGSTVVLLFEKGAIEFDADLCANTKAGFETYLRMGESIGKASDRATRRTVDAQ